MAKLGANCDEFAQFTAALLFLVNSARASPMLSPDGSSLTGVNVGGTLYNVIFGDGNENEVTAGVVFDSARKAEADAVSAAIAEALTEIGALERLVPTMT